MTVIKSLVMAFSCFSRIPVPQTEWGPKSMRYMMCFFPFIGIVIGLLCWFWCWLVGALHFNAFVLAGGLCVIPILVTGGIHLDGLADCIDAQASHAEPEHKREILKDPHSGAFAVIGIGSYLILFFAFATEFVPQWQSVFLLGCIFFVSRCLSGIATVAFPSSSSQGMLASFHDSAEKRASLIALVVELVLCAACMIWAQPICAACMLSVCVLSILLCYAFAKTQFGGMSGDIAGAFLQMTELALFICLIASWKVLGL